MIKMCGTVQVSRLVHCLIVVHSGVKINRIFLASKVSNEKFRSVLHDLMVKLTADTFAFWCLFFFF